MTELIGVIKRGGACALYEADYLQFMLNLRRRVGARHAEEMRAGLSLVDEACAEDYVRWMQQFRIELSEVFSDFASLEPAEHDENLEYFVPQVLIDFDDRSFHCSHAERLYLNFGEYLPVGWTYEEPSRLSTLLPSELDYQERLIARATDVDRASSTG